ncbi:MAG: competence/damage-inducible protein A [Acidimicrobiia bacterium]
MNVEMLAVGTELLLGQIVNTNASAIGEMLADAGLDHFHQSVVGDNLGRVADAIALATSRADAVIISGGIGPTKDDITREAIAEATVKALVRDTEYEQQLREFWERRGRVMPESNLRQADRPEGAELIPNHKGTAPGLRLRYEGAWIFAVPGVPAEMLPMVERHILPFLRRSAGGEEGVMVSRLLRTWGDSESRVGEVLDDLFEDGTNPTVAFLASAGEIKVRLTAKASTEDEALRLIDPVEEEVRRRLGPRVFGADADTIERVVLAGIAERGWTLGTAESATGGMIAARITGVPGASDVFRGAVVAYDVAVKTGVLGVDPSLVAEHGVVSEAVALAMADGAAARLGADVVVATTGAAGPEPLESAAAGTMVIAVRTPDRQVARTLRLPGDRERVRA